MPDHKYNYPVEACDVSDRMRLHLYREKRSEWLHLMIGDPDHAVWRQITTMLWNNAVFRTTNEARRLAIEGKRASAALNGPLAQFIDQGFVATQTLSIRRLMDQANRKPDRQIISLQRVLADIRAHRELITREHYVAYDALPYDPEPARQRHFKQVLAESTGGISSSWLPTTGPEAFNMAESAHESFDRLSDTYREKRRRHDLIRSEVFEELETALAKSNWKDIAKFGDKFIAHAADAHSRGLLRDGQTGFSLDQLARCHQAICQVANAVYGSLLWVGTHGLFPTPQFQQFEYLDAAWATATDQVALREFWDRHAAEIERWTITDLLN